MMLGIAILVLVFYYVYKHTMNETIPQLMMQRNRLAHDPIGNTTLHSHQLDDRFPTYKTLPNHGLFIDEVRVGPGSCIYSKRDPHYDGVLPNWECTNEWFKKAWKSPRNVSEVYNMNLRTDEDCGCNPYV